MPEGDEMPHTTQEVSAAKLLGSMHATLQHVQQSVDEIKAGQEKTTDVAYSAKRKADEAHRISQEAKTVANEAKQAVDAVKTRQAETKWFWKALDKSQPILLWSGFLYLLGKSKGVIG